MNILIDNEVLEVSVLILMKLNEVKMGIPIKVDGAMRIVYQKYIDANTCFWRLLIRSTSKRRTSPAPSAL